MERANAVEESFKWLDYDKILRLRYVRASLRSAQNDISSLVGPPKMLPPRKMTEMLERDGHEFVTSSFIAALRN